MQSGWKVSRLALSPTAQNGRILKEEKREKRESVRERDREKMWRFSQPLTPLPKWVPLGRQRRLCCAQQCAIKTKLSFFFASVANCWLRMGCSSLKISISETDHFNTCFVEKKTKNTKENVRCCLWKSAVLFQRRKVFQRIQSHNTDCVTVKHQKKTQRGTIFLPECVWPQCKNKNKISTHNLSHSSSSSYSKWQEEISLIIINGRINWLGGDSGPTQEDIFFPR